MQAQKNHAIILFIAVFTFRFAVTKPNDIKGIVQPKNKTLASQAVPNLYKVLSSAKHNRSYFEEWGYIVCFPCYGAQWGTSSYMVTNIFQNIFSDRIIKHVWNNLRVSKCSQTFHFWLKLITKHGTGTDLGTSAGFPYRHVLLEKV